MTGLACQDLTQPDLVGKQVQLEIGRCAGHNPGTVLDPEPEQVPPSYC